MPVKIKLACPVTVRRFATHQFEVEIFKHKVIGRFLPKSKLTPSGEIKELPEDRIYNITECRRWLNKFGVETLLFSLKPGYWLEYQKDGTDKLEIDELLVSKGEKSVSEYFDLQSPIFESIVISK